MKMKILLFGFAAAVLTSCSTYRAGQTPDDVYYSPARQAVAKVETKQSRYEDNYVTREDDQYLRLKVRNNQRWSTIDDYEYWNDSRYTPYYSYDYYRSNWDLFTLNNLYPNYYSPYSTSSFGFRYNPYYYGSSVANGYYGGSYFKSQNYITKRPPAVNRPSLNSYSNRNYNNNNSSNLGNTIMKIFEPSSNANTRYSNTNTTSSNNTYTAPERTYSPPPASSSSSSSSGSGSSGGGVSRPARNGN